MSNKCNPLPPVETILSEYNYDPVSGIFTHAYTKSGGNGIKDAPAGTAGSNRYSQISVKSKRFMAHRLACKLIYGFDPPDKVDHRDRNRQNNSAKNLRFALQAENNRNSSLGKNNTSGWKGVSPFRDRWRASISVNGKHKHLGVFLDPVLAAQAYVEAARTYYQEFASVG